MAFRECQIQSSVTFSIPLDLLPTTTALLHKTNTCLREPCSMRSLATEHAPTRKHEGCPTPHKKSRISLISINTCLSAEVVLLQAYGTVSRHVENSASRRTFMCVRPRFQVLAPKTWPLGGYSAIKVLKRRCGPAPASLTLFGANYLV